MSCECCCSISIVLSVVHGSPMQPVIVQSVFYVEWKGTAYVDLILDLNYILHFLVFPTGLWLSIRGEWMWYCRVLHWGFWPGMYAEAFSASLLMFACTHFHISLRRKIQISKLHTHMPKITAGGYFLILTKPFKRNKKIS